MEAELDVAEQLTRKQQQLVILQSSYPRWAEQVILPEYALVDCNPSSLSVAVVPLDGKAG